LLLANFITLALALDNRGLDNPLYTSFEVHVTVSQVFDKAARYALTSENLNLSRDHSGVVTKLPNYTCSCSCCKTMEKPDADWIDLTCYRTISGQIWRPLALLVREGPAQAPQKNLGNGRGPSYDYLATSNITKVAFTRTDFMKGPSGGLPFGTL
jgi:hypothetical protein